MSQQFLGPAHQLNVQQSVVRFFNFSMSESTQAQLDHSSVVQDLRGRIRVRYRVLQVRHEHQVTSLEPVVVNGVVIDVAQNSLSAKPV